MNLHLKEIETLQNALREREKHITELENRLSALWDKLEGERKHYQERIRQLERELNAANERIKRLEREIELFREHADYGDVRALRNLLLKRELGEIELPEYDKEGEL